MDETTFEIRVCNICGLRYPLQKDSSFGIRCPVCLGETKSVARRVVRTEEQVNENPTERTVCLRAVLLDNIRSAWNVGSIFRSADGFGFDHMHLCGITPTPENEAVKKTSLGAEDGIPWSYHKDAVKLIDGLKREGWHIIALEEGGDTLKTDLLSLGSINRSVLILGSERTGIDPGLITMCDQVISIPMRGVKRSLNVAIAFSVAAFILGNNS